MHCSLLPPRLETSGWNAMFTRHLRRATSKRGRLLRIVGASCESGACRAIRWRDLLDVRSALMAAPVFGRRHAVEAPELFREVALVVDPDGRHYFLDAEERLREQPRRLLELEPPREDGRRHPDLRQEQMRQVPRRDVDLIGEVRHPERLGRVRL